MHVHNVANTTTHTVLFFEFRDTNGRTITSFFQAIKNPDISLGAFDTLDQAERAIKITQKLNISPGKYKE